MPRSFSMTDVNGCAAWNPTTRLTKSGPSKPTAALRYAREKNASGQVCAICAQAVARFFSGSTLLPAATNTRTWPGLSSVIDCSLLQFCARAQHCHANVLAVADGAGLVDRQPHPVDREFLEDHDCGAMRQRFDQLEL